MIDKQTPLAIADPTAPRVYQVRDWDKHFENRQSRVVKNLLWVPVPNSHDGEGYRYVMAEVDGLAIYGAWQLILQVASKCQQRGTLMRDDGTPMTARMISVKCGWSRERDIQRALDFCSQPEVGWITVLNPNEIKGKQTECQHADSTLTVECQSTGQEGRKEGTPRRENDRAVADEQRNGKDTTDQSKRTDPVAVDHPHNSHADRVDPRLKAAAVSVVRVVYALQGDTDMNREPLIEELDPVMSALSNGFVEKELVAVAKMVKTAWRDRGDMMIHFCPKTLYRLDKLRSQVNVARSHGLLSPPRESHANAPRRSYQPEKLSPTEQAEVDALVKGLSEKYKRKG